MNNSVQRKAPKNLFWKIISFPLTRIIIALVFILVPTILIAELLSFISKTFSLDWGMYRRLVKMLLTIPAVHFFYLLFVRIIEKRKAGELGISGSLRELGNGILYGAGLFVVIIGIVWGLGYYRVSGFNYWTVMIPAFISAVIAGYVEELIIRGVIMRIMEESLGTWIALAFTAVLFGALHIGNDNATLVSSLAIAVTAGVMLAAAYILTRRLWLAIGIHFAWNFTQGGIFSVAVSGNETSGILEATIEGPEIITGGAFGVESSILTVILGFLLGVWFLYRSYKRKHFISPFWIRSKSKDQQDN